MTILQFVLVSNRSRIGVLQMDTEGVLQLLNFRRNIFDEIFSYRIMRREWGRE